MFTGHQVGFQVAAHARAKSLPSEMTTGLDWKVAQELGTIMIKKANTFRRKPRKIWNFFPLPSAIASQPYQ